jgi:hypothetical protein
MTEISTTKKCPYCGEDIKVEAIVCRYCQHGVLDSDHHDEITTTGIKHITKKGKVLSQEVTRRQNEGWVLISQTDEAAQMTKPKNFNWGLFFILLIVGIFLIELPLFIYIIVFAFGKPEMVTLTVNDDMMVVSNGIQPHIPTPGTPSVPLTPEEETAKKNTRTALIVIGVAVLILAIIFCAANQNGGYAPIGAIQSLVQFI